MKDCGSNLPDSNVAFAICRDKAQNSMTRWSHIAIVTALLASATGSPAAPAGREPEPTPDVIASGQCQVPTCYQLDLKEVKFRIYSANRAILYRHIPKGACACTAIKDDPDFVGLSASMAFETKDGARIGNVAIGRAKDKSDINLQTTYERFLSEQDKFEEVSDFRYRDFDFSDYRIYRERKARALDNRRYYFIPKKPQYLVRGSQMEIAFNTPLGRLPGDTRELTVAANLRLSDGIYFFQFLNPRLTAPAQWPATVEKTVGLIETRLFPK